MTVIPTKRTRADTVYDAVRVEVLSAHIPPGSKLKLADYSERFQVSLAVVREAMGRLAGQGLVQANPQRGFSTMPLSIDDLEELTRARVIIETATLRESIASGDLDWEAAVVGAHHRLASTPPDDSSGTFAPGFAEAHRAFHLALLAGSGNTHLESTATYFRDRAELYRYWSRHLGGDTDRDVAHEHSRLCELAVARNADAAAEALEQHIQRTTDMLLRYARDTEK